ncbi:methyltransferase domain-containing protein [Lignipirellula cremea]|uniref:Methyltransferase type 11 domain-containing protein n=1 Tax=Lignipirellula cremea TaxID=2528010 RepID=A0A518DS23_9BACT|nr:methyltransferase domain-containing protein [Lignipirellula cremea]QDU94629.1 hypothetical protein Pla8534_24220 [Lignipirellula cremea]
MNHLFPPWLSSWREKMRNVIGAVALRTWRRNRLFPQKQASWKGKAGLEIGGPSALFSKRSYLPIYPVAGTMDNVNFAGQTVWEGEIAQGRTFLFDPQKQPGVQFLCEATELTPASGTYDFLLSSHTLEHVANPIKALREWLRVLKADGAMTIVLPHKERTFDHRRQVTTLQHLIEDAEADRGENDLSHLPEILALHDLARDPLAGNFEAFQKRSQQNPQLRCLHHHVFDTQAAVQLLDYVNLQIQQVETVPPHDIVVHGVKCDSPARNAPFLGPDAAWRKQSCFPSDRMQAGR